MGLSLSEQKLFKSKLHWTDDETSTLKAVYKDFQDTVDELKATYDKSKDDLVDQSGTSSNRLPDSPSKSKFPELEAAHHHGDGVHGPCSVGP